MCAGLYGGDSLAKPQTSASMPTMPGMPGMAAAKDTSPKAMRMAMVPDPLGVSMARLGSGTSWIPDASPLPSRQFTADEWNLMLHGFVFGQYDAQSGARGSDQAGSLNWGMLMASHELACGRFQVRAMLSLDPLGVTARGYPLLLQTGETVNGVPLHDRQHPHDFWMELSTMYDRPVSRSLGVSLYAAPSGEPALGPVAFMHRPSAMDNPTAPISHHWQDATHISFGVLTAGVFTHEWRIEGSAFNGREPNENRWDFDPIVLDSYSGRVSFNPTERWALNASVGFLKSPEALTPTVSMHRAVASAMYGEALGSGGMFAATAVWGANWHSDAPGASNSALLEAEAMLDDKNTVIGRAEFVQKSAAELSLDTAPAAFPPASDSTLASSRWGTFARSCRFVALRWGWACSGR